MRIMFKTKAEELKEKQIKEVIQVFIACCGHIARCHSNLKRKQLPHYFDSISARMEIKSRISAIGHILEKEEDPKKASKKVEIEIDQIASLYVSISEYNLLIKDDPTSAKSVLKACIKFMAANSTSLADSDPSLTKVLELRVKTCQNMIESSLSMMPLYNSKANRQTIQANVDWILHAYAGCELKLLKIDKQLILAQLIVCILQSVDRFGMARLEMTAKYITDALQHDFQIDLADINNSDTILRIFLIFRSEHLPAFNKSAILEMVIICKILQEIVFPMQKELATLNNHNHTIASCIQFLKKFSEGTEMIELLKDLIDEVYLLLGISKQNENLNDTFYLEQFGRRDVILVQERNEEAEAEAVRALNLEYEGYVKAAGKSFLEQYLNKNMPVEDTSRWRAKNPEDIKVKRASSSMKIKKRHIHKSTDSLLKCRAQKIESAITAKNLELETTGAKDTTEDQNTTQDKDKM